MRIEVPTSLGKSLSRLGALFLCSALGILGAASPAFGVDSKQAMHEAGPMPVAAGQEDGAAFDKRLVNISTRGQVQTGNNVMIGGFVISGTTTKNVLIRGRGPSLTAAGVPGALPDPVVQLYSGSSLIASNDDWVNATNASAIQATGLAPSSGLESALYVGLAPGAYTAVMSGYQGQTGVGIIEVFEMSATATPLINISTRGPVYTADNRMIGGFVISGTTQTVLIRGRGPSLAAAGVSGAMADPVITLYSGSTAIVQNDDWQDAPNASAIAASGYAPTSGLESVIYYNLIPGAYTVVMEGYASSTGVGIFEVFALSP